ncbi:MAG: hypothetical protein IPL52_09105 [Flavobacteriales bacterium]|nr:hypothetical protein [Flavobacteriales bacterium]
MRCAILLFTLLIRIPLLAQQPEGTPAHVGYADTLLFNDGLRYAAFGYDGPAPLFVQVWYPMHDDPGSAALRYADLRTRTLHGPLRRVYDELLLRMDSAFIEYDLRYPFDGDVPIDYAPFTEQQVKDSLFALPTTAHRAMLPTALSLPVIVYHHGSQGMSDENVRMAEHFAANGFVFLSCNFHWPLEHGMYGTPLVWEPDTGSIRTVLRFARELANGNKVFYIGHSWGAQEGWCTLHEPGLADGFVSLETTMEWKTDTTEVRDKWPYVLDAITTQHYPMPILMVADTEGEPPFQMFKGVHGELRYLDPKKPFAHENYTSAYLMRSQGAGGFNVPDRAALREQEVVYEALLDELLAFLQGHVAMSTQRKADPQSDFFHRR